MAIYSLSALSQVCVCVGYNMNMSRAHLKDGAQTSWTHCRSSCRTGLNQNALHVILTVTMTRWVLVLDGFGREPSLLACWLALKLMVLPAARSCPHWITCSQINKGLERNPFHQNRISTFETFKNNLKTEHELSSRTTFPLWPELQQIIIYNSITRVITFKGEKCTLWTSFYV